MHQEIRLHGQINGTVEYFATLAARDAYRSHFYEAGDGTLRLFSPGSEFVLGPDGVSHRGNGGSFCEYMFGIDQPLADLAKPDVRNRLVLYGATIRDDGSLLFTGHTEGQQSYERIFFEGNAVANFFFFLTGSVTGPLREQQKEILRLLGRLLKRSPGVAVGDDAALIDELVGLLGHRSSLCLIKLVHKRHRRYHDAFVESYRAHKGLPEAEIDELQEFAEELGIDRYQQERIRIDVMYKHPDNRRIVDEYQQILLDCSHRGRIGQQENTRLTRLKTLSVRSKIPVALFYTLDELLKRDTLIDLDEQDYLGETRRILDGIFLHERLAETEPDRDELLKLLDAKRRASENRDHAFEQILLETGKACDEKIRDGAGIALIEGFSRIVTYFDRYDNSSANISQLAFMENVRLGEPAVRSLLGDKNAFDVLAPGLFERLFFTGLLANKYLGSFGRQKILTLRQGLGAIEQGRLTTGELVAELDAITEREKLYALIFAHVRERIRNFYSRYSTRSEQQALFEEVNEELRHKEMLSGTIPQDLFREAIVSIKKEAIYLHNLLPSIVVHRDVALREDFLDNGGLDRFYVEELEREYFELNNLEIDDLNLIRKGLGA